VQAAVDRMQPSRQSDDEIAQLLHDARFKPEAASTQEAAFFAKHGCASSLIVNAATLFIKGLAKIQPRLTLAHRKFQPAAPQVVVDKHGNAEQLHHTNVLQIPPVSVANHPWNNTTAQLQQRYMRLAPASVCIPVS